MITRTAAQLLEHARSALVAAGADADSARIVAHQLVDANLNGVDTHGVMQLPGYVADLEQGWIDGTSKPSVLRETRGSALVTGNWSFGQVGAEYATRVGMQKASDAGVAVVALVQSHHIGRLGYYVELAAAEQLIGMIWGGGYGAEVPLSMPYGGRQRLLHTNPMAFAFPGGDEPPLQFDFATSAVAGVKVEEALRKHEQLPVGSIVDRDGRPTTDPADFYAGGGHVAFGGHKGYALMLAAEFMGRIFSGADGFADPARGGPVMRRQGVTFMFLRADLFSPLADTLRRADDFERRTRAVPPADGFDAVRIPGDPERATRARRAVEGIPLDDAIWERLARLPTTT